MYKYLFSIFYYIGIIGSIQDEYNQYSFYQKRPLSPRPLDAMADLTNDLGVCVLRVGMQRYSYYYVLKTVTVRWPGQNY